jgi:hypothetical protein
MPQKRGKRPKKGDEGDDNGNDDGWCNCAELCKLSVLTILCFCVGLRASDSILTKQTGDEGGLGAMAQTAQALQARVKAQDTLIELQLKSNKLLSERVVKLESEEKALSLKIGAIRVGEEMSTTTAAQPEVQEGEGFLFTKGGSELLTLPKPMDTADLGNSFTVEVSIKLSSQDTEATIKTILSNKVGGCNAVVGDGHFGYSLSVNSWDTSDRQLVLEWGNMRTGCEKLKSGIENIVPYDEWVRISVGFEDLEADDPSAATREARKMRMKLGINGKVVATVDGVRATQKMSGLHVGAHLNRICAISSVAPHCSFDTGGQMHFSGSMRDISFFKGQRLGAVAAASTIVTALVYETDPSLLAYFPLQGRDMAAMEAEALSVWHSAEAKRSKAQTATPLH